MQDQLFVWWRTMKFKEIKLVSDRLGAEFDSKAYHHQVMRLKADMPWICEIWAFPSVTSKHTSLEQPSGSASTQIPETKQSAWQLDFHSLPWREASFPLCLESSSVGQYTQDHNLQGDGETI